MNCDGVAQNVKFVAADCFVGLSSRRKDMAGFPAMLVAQGLSRARRRGTTAMFVTNTVREDRSDGNNQTIGFVLGRFAISSVDRGKISAISVEASGERQGLMRT